MAFIIAVAGQKGGAGKTTVAVCLAAEGVRRGRRVLLVDADPQGSARTWHQTAQERGAPAPAVVALDGTMHKPGQLDRLSAGFDLVVIDLPPRLGAVQRSALVCADVALLPCGPAALDVWSLAETAALVTEAQTVRPGLRPLVVLTRVQSRTAVGRAARDAAASAGLPVAGVVLGYRVAYQESIAAGQAVTTYAPHDRAADEIRALFDELTTQENHGQETAPRRRSQAAARPSAPGANSGRVRQSKPGARRGG